MLSRRASPFFQPKIRAVAASRAQRSYMEALRQNLSYRDARNAWAETYAEAIVELNEAHPMVSK